MQLDDFRCICPLISKTAAITLTNSFKYTHLGYCNSLFYDLLNYSIHCLQKIKTTPNLNRIVTRSIRSSLTFLILKFLHWLPVNYCINYKICCIMHRALFLHKPHYLNSLHSLRSNSHSLRSSSFSPLLFTIFQLKITWFSFIFICCTSSLESNNGPNNVSTEPTCMSFRTIYK